MKTFKDPETRARVISLNDARPANDNRNPNDSDFSDLAKKLEKRLNQIESTVKGSFDLLEKDIQKILKEKEFRGREKEVRLEIGRLGDELEKRFTKTLTRLQKKKDLTAPDKEQLDLVKSLAKHLVHVLSFDFYKNILGSLRTSDIEEEIDPFGMDYRLVERIKPIFDFLYYRYWRVETTGIDNIPSDGKALIVGNHSGTVPYDGAMIKMAVMNEHKSRTDVRFLVEDFVYHMPILGTFMYRIGGVRASPDNARRLLEAGHLVVVFPEGVKGIGKHYSQRYQLQRFGRGGFIKLCMREKSPLIPVAVTGAEEIHPILFKSNILAKTIGIPYLPITPTFPLMGLLGCVPFPTKWHIRFGKPMTFDQYGPEATEDELLVHKLSEKVRNEIQEMILELLKNRRSIWGG